MKKYLLYIICFLFCTSCNWMHETLEPSIVGEPSDAYITIALDTGAGEDEAARADASTLEDGSDKEYTINYAILLLFKGGSATNPDGSTFCAGAPMIKINEEGSSTDHISRRYMAKFYLQEFKLEDGAQYWGIIIANPNGYMSVTKDSYSYTQESGSGFTISTIKASDNYTYSDFIDNQAFVMPHGLQPHGFFAKEGYVTMTNSLLYDKLPSTSEPNPKPLPLAVNVTGKITKSADDSDPSKIAVFYLERVLAKVSVVLAQQGSNSTDWNAQWNYSFPYEYTLYTSTEPQEKHNLSVSVAGWKLVNLSNSTYLLQHFDHGWVGLRSNDPSHLIYRMVGMPNNGESTPGVEDGQYYRVNFSKRSEYSSQLSELLPTYMAGHQWEGAWSTSSALYCPENTMAVEHMMVKNDTHVLVRVNYNVNYDGTTYHDFYIIGEDKTKLYGLSQLKDKLAVDYSTTAANIEITQNANSSQCTATADGVECTVTADGVEKSLRIDIYKDGYAYYLLPISHFGNYYTPWNKNETPSPLPIDRGSTDNINRSYPEDYRNGNYLGRWGVVRNNWYKLTITGVSTIGAPQDYSVEHSLITKDNTPLDYYESGVKVWLKVDPWTLRAQKVEIVTP